MNYSKYLLFGLVLYLSSQAVCQKIISGTVVDSLTDRPQAYVNIGIENKTIGTSSNESGNFRIKIPQELLNDTLTFSMVGYKDQRLPISYFSLDKQVKIQLNEHTNQLDPVEIDASRLVERKYGIKRRNLLVHFSDGMFQEDDVFEIGQLIRLKNHKAQITSVNLYLFDSARDSVTLRVNFYAIEDGIPTSRLINKSIIQRHPVDKGWLELDIYNEKIILEEDFVVSLESIPEGGETQKVFYEVKLGGSSRSFYRKNSFGKWNTPPHHYCLFVTALVDKDTPEEPEEVETLPTTTLWSEHVKDSFYIFLRLPPNYAKEKKRYFPTLFCLDANGYFDQVSQIIEDLSSKNAIGSEPILVGIGYRNAYEMDSLRVRDYTFPEALESDSLPISGGGDAFYNFLKLELIPYLNENYRIDHKEVTLLGHSIGGYFVSYNLLQDQLESPVFRNYIAASPSLWYNDGFVVKQFDSLLANIGNRSQNILLAIGEEELIQGNEYYFDSFKNSVSKLGSIELKSTIYPGLDHMGVAIPAFEDAIRFLFKD